MARLLNQATANYSQDNVAVRETSDAYLNVVGEDVTFTKTVAPPAAKVGDAVTYTITIANNNTADSITNVVVSDTVNPRTAIVADSLKVDGVAFVGDITTGITFPTLAVGESKVITFDATVLAQ